MRKRLLFLTAVAIATISGLFLSSAAPVKADGACSPMVLNVFHQGFSSSRDGGIATDYAVQMRYCPNTEHQKLTQVIASTLDGINLGTIYAHDMPENQVFMWKFSGKDGLIESKMKFTLVYDLGTIKNFSSFTVDTTKISSAMFGEGNIYFTGSNFGPDLQKYVFNFLSYNSWNGSPLNLRVKPATWVKPNYNFAVLKDVSNHMALIDNANTVTPVTSWLFMPAGTKGKLRFNTFSNARNYNVAIVRPPVLNSRDGSGTYDMFFRTVHTFELNVPGAVQN